jgi:hypothetical protein
MGLRLNEQLQLEQVRSPLLDIEVRVKVNDLETALGPEEIATLADLGPRFDVRDVGSIPVIRAENVNLNYLQLTLRQPVTPEADRRSPVADDR